MEEKRFEDEEVIDICEFLEENAVLEDVKAIIVALLEDVFDADKDQSINFIRQYLSKKKESVELRKKKGYFE